MGWRAIANSSNKRLYLDMTFQKNIIPHAMWHMRGRKNSITYPVNVKAIRTMSWNVNHHIPLQPPMCKVWSLGAINWEYFSLCCILVEIVEQSARADSFPKEVSQATIECSFLHFRIITDKPQSVTDVHPLMLTKFKDSQTSDMLWRSESVHTLKC